MQNRHLPGRLSNPELTLSTDPRCDPRIAAALEAFGDIFGGIVLPKKEASYEERLEYCQALEDVGVLAHPIVAAAMPEFPTVTSRIETIKGVDGNDITLYIHESIEKQDARPCIIHTHGGGMVFMTAADPGFVRWRKTLAATGLLVIGVEFRNGAGRLGNHPFPAGLNDCSSALNWVNDRREEFCISNIILSGESGGGNLAISTALKAKEEGNQEWVDGVYAMCPYISGAYEKPPAELLSLEENEGYSMSCHMMATLVKLYDPSGEYSCNPLAWPYQASVEELRGLPPHIVSVNELDPLRDEGLEFYRRLQKAGNSAVARTVHGTHHAGDVSFPDLTPDTYQQTIDSLVGFANSL